jgi:hypothetical protein
MPVPKTTVHLNNYAMPTHDDVRPPGEPSLVKPKAEAHCMNDLTDQKFWLRMLLAYASHNARPLRSDWRLGGCGCGGLKFSFAAMLLANNPLRSRCRLVLSNRICHKRFRNSGVLVG